LGTRGQHANHRSRDSGITIGRGASIISGLHVI
jgi:hypothetical protein